MTSVARDVTGRVSAWLQGNLIIGAIMGSATALAMGVLGEPYFWVVALVAALAEAVPIAGPILAGLFAVLLALTVSGQLALWVALVSSYCTRSKPTSSFPKSWNGRWA